MYVDASARRRGIGRQVLEFAEAECRRRNRLKLVLSTSELQSEALSKQVALGEFKGGYDETSAPQVPPSGRGLVKLE